MIILPVVIPVVSGIIGIYTLGYVSNVTKELTFSEFFYRTESYVDVYPYLCYIFLLMVTPISVAAIATAIGLSGLEVVQLIWVL